MMAHTLLPPHQCSLVLDVSLRGKESFSASEATATARRQLEDEEEKAQEALVRDK